MKNILKISIVLFVLATFASCNCFKNMVKNSADVKISCSPEVLVLNNGKIAADITAEIPAKYFDKSAAVRVTPIICYKGGIAEGETVILQGEKVAANGIVISRQNKMSITRHIEFNYRPEMDECALKLLIEIKCKSGKCNTFTLINANTGEILTASQLAIVKSDDKMANALKSECAILIANGLNTLQKDLSYADAMKPMANNYKNVTTEVVKADIVYKINSANVEKNATKTEQLNNLKANVEGNVGNDRVSQSVYVKGYASPDGPEKFNDKLSEKRSQSGLKAVEQLLKDAGLNIDAAAYGEDWEGFQAAVAASNIKDKDLILQVLKMYSSSAERENEIKNLSSVFSALKTDVLPQLRRAQVINSADITGKTDAEMLEVIKAGNVADLTIEELLHIAEVEPSVAEVALKAAADKGDARAYNNLAIVYAKAGNYAAAAKALAKATRNGANGTEINDNLALISLANGDVAKAQEYAAAASKDVKGLLAAAKGEYSIAAKNLEGYNAAIANVQDGNLAAAKRSLAGDDSARADYLRAVIAAKEGNLTEAKAQLNSAIAKDRTLAEKAVKDINLRTIK